MDIRRKLEEEMSKHLSANKGVTEMVAAILNEMIDEPIIDNDGDIAGMSFKPNSALQLLFALACFVWEKVAVSEAESVEDEERKTELLKQAKRWSLKAALHLTNEPDVLVSILRADAETQYSLIPESEWVEMEERMEGMSTDKDNLDRMKIENILRKHHEPDPGATLH